MACSVPCTCPTCRQRLQSLVRPPKAPEPGTRPRLLRDGQMRPSPVCKGLCTHRQVWPGTCCHTHTATAAAVRRQKLLLGLPLATSVEAMPRTTVPMRAAQKGLKPTQVVNCLVPHIQIVHFADPSNASLQLAIMLCSWFIGPCACTALAESKQLSPPVALIRKNLQVHAAGAARVEASTQTQTLNIWTPSQCSTPSTPVAKPGACQRAAQSLP